MGRRNRKRIKNQYEICLDFLNEYLAIESEEINREILPVPDIKQNIKTFDVNLFWDTIKTVSKAKYKVKVDKSYITCHEAIQCLRQTWYQRMGCEPHYNAIGKYPFGSLKACIGHVVEKYIAHTYEVHSGVPLEKNVYIWSKDKKFNGVADIILDKSVVIDVKYTTNKSDKHLHQALLYAYILNRDMYYNINKVEILYINDQYRIEKLSRPYEELIPLAKSLYSRVDDLLNHINERTMPPMEKSADCKYCVYQRSCGNNELTVIDENQYVQNVKSNVNITNNNNTGIVNVNAKLKPAIPVNINVTQTKQSKTHKKTFWTH